MSVELRYRGDLLGRYSDATSASAIARDHLGLGVAEKKDHHVEDEDSITIEPARSFELYQHGRLVDTFHDAAAATAVLQARLAKVNASHPRAAVAIEHFDLIDTSTGDTIHKRQLAHEIARETKREPAP